MVATRPFSVKFELLLVVQANVVLLLTNKRFRTLPHHLPVSVCTGDIPGIEATYDEYSVCCAEECSTCTGARCGPGTNSTLSAEDCCGDEIVASGILCSVSGEAPCLLNGKRDKLLCVALTMVVLLMSCLRFKQP